MKTISSAFRAHLAQPYQTRAFCWLCVRRDGFILGITEHDEAITFNLEAAMIAVGLTPGPGVAGTGSRTYSAEAGYRGSDIASSGGLNVDTGEAEGLLVSPSITEADLLAGLWDYARITVFQVNWHDLTMGAMLERSGTLGEVTIDRGFFRAEWRGLMQAYQQNVGRLYSPVCDAVLGDARCQKDLTAFTFNFTVTGLNPDLLTFYSTDLTQPGPTGGIAITNITNANPGQVVMASPGTFANSDIVTLSGIVGPTSLNNTTVIRGLSGSTWNLGVNTTNTTDYPPYVSGGLVTPLGGNAGYFDAGLVTWLTGNNAGLSEVVRSYTPGQVTLQLPMPYTRQVGDTGRIVAGCIKSKAQCRDKFNNILNRRAFDYFPGFDFIVQVGSPK